MEWFEVFIVVVVTLICMRYNGIELYTHSDNFLLLILHYSHTRCNHWGKLGDGYMGLWVLFLKLLIN